MENERYVIFMSKNSVHVDFVKHKTFEEAWEYAKTSFDTLEASGSSIKLTHASAEQCLKYDPKGRAHGGAMNMWSIATYLNGHDWTHAFIARIVV
jgi:hypothetical protein